MSICVTFADGEDDDNGGDNLRPVLVADTHHYADRRLKPGNLVVSFSTVVLAFV
jgi:hypothetical protein